MEHLPESPLEALRTTIESSLSARRATLEERLRRIELALVTYRRAAETDLARDFAREHGFKIPPPASPSAARAAELLNRAVSALPELSTSVEATTPPAVSTSAIAPPEVALAAGATSALAGALERKRLVVLGSLAGRDRASALPPEIAECVDWVDTEHDGAHAIGNLPQRIRQGRVAALVILERAVKHRHTDAVMAAARDSGVPVAFAGQGGKASIARAVAQIEAALAGSAG